ncbi:hypothetical protein ACFSKM_00510 [Ancylobacter dichloromethanicus]
MIELNTIAAMGHGTPLGDGLGVPGPYMLEVGISSTREIVKFWGISEAGEDAVTCSAPAAVQGKLVELPSPAGVKKRARPRSMRRPRARDLRHPVKSA